MDVETGGEGQGRSVRVDSMDDGVSFMDGSPDQRASGCRGASDKSQCHCPGLITGASARLRRWTCGCVHTTRTDVWGGVPIHLAAGSVLCVA